MLLKEVEKYVDAGIKAIAVFPNVEQNLKTQDCRESYNPDNLICRSIRQIKANFPEIGIIADIALDPYNIHGHDGLVENNEILNDKTIDLLIKQSLVNIDSGADIIAPSDMMDGRIGLIRRALEDHNFHNAKILSYTAKYASNLYGPFRDAVGSDANLVSDKKSYQMDFANSNEALIEARLDVSEGADMVMVKPASFYLDIIYRIKQEVLQPVFAYQVSGEYAMMKLAYHNKIASSFEELLIESLVACKRAGASAIFTYGAHEISRYLTEFNN